MAKDKTPAAGRTSRKIEKAKAVKSDAPKSRSPGHKPRGELVLAGPSADMRVDIPPTATDPLIELDYQNHAKTDKLPSWTWSDLPLGALFGVVVYTAALAVGIFVLDMRHSDTPASDPANMPTTSQMAAILSDCERTNGRPCVATAVPVDVLEVGP